MSDTLPPPPDDLNALPPGTRFGELEIQRLLGTGGFGIVYLAKDHALERLVAIKEYMPGQLAQRGQNSQVSVRSGSMRETFELGLRSFVNEARLLARFDHRSLLKVYRFWEANNTAYMAMPYLQGQTLKQWRDARGRAPDGDWLLQLLKPLTEALAELHAASVYHRDIAPDNIFLPADGGDPILLDFGAARRAIGDRTQSFTAILKPSYAPLEQYDGASALRQGPWTDLYALGAVLYHLITGAPPPAATRRALADEYQGLAGRELPGYPLALLAAVDWALALRPQDRPQSIGEFQEALRGQRTIPLRPRAAPQSATLGADGANALAPTEIAAVTVPAVQPLHELTQLLTQVQARTETDATEPLSRTAPPVVATTGALAAAAPPQPPPPPSAAVPPSPAAAAAASAPAARRPWVLLGALLVPVLIAALWLVLRGNAERELPGPSLAASAPVPLPWVAASAAGDPAAAPVVAGPGAVDAASAGAVAARAPAAEVPPGRTAKDGAPPPRPAVRAEPKPEPRRPPAPVPVVQEPAPAPLQQPAPQASLPQALVAQEPPGAADPKAACGSRVFIALTMCVDRKCREPAHAQHPECVRLREIREQRERP